MDFPLKVLCLIYSVGGCCFRRYSAAVGGAGEKSGFPAGDACLDTG